MKKNHLITIMATCILCIWVNISSAQVKFPSNFESETKSQYNQLKHKEISFENYLEYRKKQYVQKANIASGAAALYDGCNESNTACGNGDFESGINAAEWDFAHGLLNAANVGDPFSMTEEQLGNATLTNPDGHHTLTSSTDPNDPNTGIAPVAPGGSTRAFRLGNRGTAQGTELISKRITVTAQQTIFSFWYAAILEEPGASSPEHIGEELGAFKVRVFRCSNNTEITGVCNLGNGSNQIVANSGDPFMQSIPFGDDRLVFKNWTCAQIDLSNHIGETVVVMFITEDCGLGSHFGYAYIDNFCGSCAGDNTISLASKPDCGPGRICFNYSIPQLNGQSGTVQIQLRIFQNGIQVGNLLSPTLSSGTQYCFDVDPANIAGINTTLPGYDFVAVGNFTLGGFSNSIIVGNPPAGQTSGQNNDVQMYCVTQCCPGRNVVRNPGFELGNQFFSTGYTYTGIVAPNSVSTGRYSLLTSAQALTVSPTWTVNCASAGKHLVINGATGLSGTRIAWYQNVTVERGKIYKFCADMKNLPQCAFDVKPKINVQFSVPGYNISNQVIDVPAGNCNWQSVSQVINMPAGTGTFSMNITITLDETGIGDGNDLAIDNIALVEIPQTPQSETLFNINYFDVTATDYSISATPVTPLGRNCGYYWSVEEVDQNYVTVPGTAVYNPSQWWTSPPYTFTGYVGTSTLSGNNPGVFSFTKRYRIVYGRWCECSGWNSFAVILVPDKANATTGGISIIKETGYSLSPTQITTIMNGGSIKREPVAATINAKPVDVVEKNTSSSTLQNSALKIYPNPVNNMLTVVLPNMNEGGTLSIFNIQGELISKTQVAQRLQKKEVNTSSLAPGTYIIQYHTTNGENAGREKFVKLNK